MDAEHEILDYSEDEDDLLGGVTGARGGSNDEDNALLDESDLLEGDNEPGDGDAPAAATVQHEPAAGAGAERGLAFEDDHGHDAVQARHRSVIARSPPADSGDNVQLVASFSGLQQHVDTQPQTSHNGNNSGGGAAGGECDSDSDGDSVGSRGRDRRRRDRHSLPFVRRRADAPIPDSLDDVKIDSATLEQLKGAGRGAGPMRRGGGAIATIRPTFQTRIMVDNKAWPSVFERHGPVVLRMAMQPGAGGMAAHTHMYQPHGVHPAHIGGAAAYATAFAAHMQQQQAPFLLPAAAPVPPMQLVGAPPMAPGLIPVNLTALPPPMSVGGHMHYAPVAAAMSPASMAAGHYVGPPPALAQPPPFVVAPASAAGGIALATASADRQPSAAAPTATTFSAHRQPVSSIRPPGTSSSSAEKRQHAGQPSAWDSHVADFLSKTTRNAARSPSASPRARSASRGRSPPSKSPRSRSPSPHVPLRRNRLSAHARLAHLAGPPPPQTHNRRFFADRSRSPRARSAERRSQRSGGGRPAPHVSNAGDGHDADSDVRLRKMLIMQQEKKKLELEVKRKTEEEQLRRHALELGLNPHEYIKQVKEQQELRQRKLQEKAAKMHQRATGVGKGSADVRASTPPPGTSPTGGDRRRKKVIYLKRVTDAPAAMAELAKAQRLDAARGDGDRDRDRDRRAKQQFSFKVEASGGKRIVLPQHKQSPSKSSGRPESQPQQGRTSVHERLAERPTSRTRRSGDGDAKRKAAGGGGGEAKTPLAEPQSQPQHGTKETCVVIRGFSAETSAKRMERIAATVGKVKLCSQPSSDRIVIVFDDATRATVFAAQYNGKSVAGATLTVKMGKVALLAKPVDKSA